MRIVRFTMNEKYYQEFKAICDQAEMTIKRKLNLLLAQDLDASNIRDFFPPDHYEKSKSVTLKINEELYKGLMKNCDKLDVGPRDYVPYLIYKFLRGI